MRGALLLVCAFLFSLGFSFGFTLEARAYVRTMAETGRPLFWASPAVSFTGNPRNSSGLTDAEVSTLFSGAIGAWSIPGTSARGSYSQSSGAPAGGGYNGVNSIFFASASGQPMEYGVVALTEVTYFLDSGQIVEADLSFNDNLYRFTANEGDTGRTIGGRLAIYLQDVATHEAGHSFGLDHSTVNLSSLIYTAFSGQFTLSADDQTAIRSIYPSAGGTGALTGYVQGRRGGIFGAHVAAINLSTGSVQAGGLANPDGSFRLGDLPPGPYALLMEPFGTSIYTISSYYQNVNHRFCGGPFRRRFYGPCGSNTAAVVNVSSGVSTPLGALSPSCDQMGNPAGAPASLATAANFPAEGGARFGTLRAGETHYYKLTGVTGLARARANSFTLYSNVDVRVDFLDEWGAPLPGATAVDNVQNPMPGGYINYDATAEASLTGGNYIMRVTAANPRLYSYVFPAGADLLDAQGHYLLSVSIDGSFGPSSPADMSACISLNNTNQSASYRAPASTSNPRRESGGGCGSLNAGGMGGGGDGSSGGSGGGGPLAGILLLVLGQALLMGHRRLKAALVRRRR